jgi:Tol biopolymer transport system component
MKTRSSTVIYEQDGIVEAPNWSRDGTHLLVNSGGNLYRIAPVSGAKLEKIALGDGSLRCNNDHDYSPDGKRIAFSASSPASRQSQVYVANADGSQIRLLTPSAPSYFHGWSPDGKWLAFVGRRNDRFELYRVSVEGGEEQRLTSAGAYDDGPEYSRDGKWVYFNSNRGGGWNIWRIPADGGGPNDVHAERVTNDDLEDWFPHFSPNGKQLIFLSFPAGTEGHNGRMPGMRLRRLKGRKAKDKSIETLATFPGGQGTINVNSWSPDSRRFAYVIYEPVSRP